MNMSNNKNYLKGVSKGKKGAKKKGNDWFLISLNQI